jgi:pyridinium-3,5-bisthiocarboxylic acid mononucleotide nickel chelatase
MRVAYLECFSGISGDMMLGALLDAGVSAELLRHTVSSLQLGAELRVTRTDRSGICATKVDVVVEGGDRLVQDAAGERPHHHNGAPTHTHENEVHSAQAGLKGVHSQNPRKHSPGRSLSVIRDLLEHADIPEIARETAIRAFELLGEAEARIHNVPIDSIHFHEVGAVDSIVDIVCAAVGCHALQVDGWICSRVNVGAGTVQCAHGSFPVPAPATLELLKEAPVYSSGIEAELVTPTGAALLRALCCRFSAFPAMEVEKVGYGAGMRNLSGAPNVLRISVGELDVSTRDDLFETVTVLETTIDDLNPQVLGYVSEHLLAEGALDVFILPAQMKKNRPGCLLTVLCDRLHATRLRELLFRETSTIGIRIREERRECLVREIIGVATPWGEIRVKVARLRSTVMSFAAEYEDCRRIAEEHSIPLKHVQQTASHAYLEQRQTVAKSGVARHA